MRRNSQLSGVLHVLLHMAKHDRPSTSEDLAKAMTTNPVVVRRILGGLRDAGLVASEKGHGGGWVIARPLEEITMLQVHEALGSAELLAIGNRTEAPQCLVEQAVNNALGAVFDQAEAVLRAGFAAVTLAMLRQDFHAGMVARGQETSHAH